MADPVANGRKDDAEKDRWDLLPWGAVREVVRVLTWGARYYAPHNWKHVDSPRDRYLAAIHRHLVERFEDGQRRDQKTSLHHLAHVVANALFLLWFDLTDDLVVEPAGGDRFVCVDCGTKGPGTLEHHKQFCPGPSPYAERPDRG